MRCEALAEDRREAASISLFMACVLTALLLVNLIVLAGGKSLLLQTQAGMRLEQECERALSSYDSDLYRDFGLWGMAEGLDERLAQEADVLRARAELQGLKELKFSLSEPLYEEENFREQLLNFMKPRFPFALAERLMLQMRELKATTDSPALQNYKNELEKPRHAEGMRDFGALLLKDKAADVRLEEDALPPAAERGGDGGLAEELLTAFQDELRSELAAPLELYTPEELGLDEPARLLQSISEVEQIFHYEAAEFYENFALNEYALRMFPSQIQASEQAEYPFNQNLRGHSLAAFDAQSKNSCEYILSAQLGAGQKASVKRKIQLTRFVLQLAGLLGNAEKMQNYQRAGRAIALLLVAVSGGQLQVPPEAITYTLVAAKSAIEAGKETRRLLTGKAVTLIPYTKGRAISSYYHDYLRVFFALVPRKALLERCAAAVEASCSRRFFTEAKVDLLWQNPFFNQKVEVYTQKRRYALYARAQNAED